MSIPSHLPRCPKCDYQRLDTERHIHPGVCPQCGIAYEKYRQAQLAKASATNTASTASTANSAATTQITPETSLIISEMIPWQQQILQLCLQTKAMHAPSSLLGLSFIWLVLFIFSLRFAFGGINPEALMGSFFHLIILPFHEFGHLLFMPLGRFMSILGGSLFQIMLPLMLMLVFIFKQRDNFAASVTLWWCGQSFIDLSPYIADARERNLPLIGGMSEDAHDWGNLLTILNALGAAKPLAYLSFSIGCGLMLLALSWGGLLLWRSYQIYLAR